MFRNIQEGRERHDAEKARVNGIVWRNTRAWETGKAVLEAGPVVGSQPRI